MKNIISLKVVTIILVAILLISVSTIAFATEVITPDQYEGAQQEDKKEESLPQTGAEDYWVAILAIVCVGSAMFAYRKVSDYRNI